jgi:hypothetical protein
MRAATNPCLLRPDSGTNALPKLRSLQMLVEIVAEKTSTLSERADPEVDVAISPLLYGSPSTPAARLPHPLSDLLIKAL